MYTIDRNIPIPTNAVRRGRSTIYPWADMKPGDSFLVRDSKKGNSIRVNAFKQSRKGKARFLVRSVKDGLRVWRVK